MWSQLECVTLAGLTAFAACLIFTFHRKEILSDSRDLSKGRFGYCFILAWLCVPLLLVSGILYVHLHKKQWAKTRDDGKPLDRRVTRFTHFNHFSINRGNKKGNTSLKWYKSALLLTQYPPYCAACYVRHYVIMVASLCEARCHSRPDKKN